MSERTLVLLEGHVSIVTPTRYTLYQSNITAHFIRTCIACYLRNYKRKIREEGKSSTDDNGRGKVLNIRALRCSNGVLIGHMSVVNSFLLPTTHTALLWLSLPFSLFSVFSSPRAQCVASPTEHFVVVVIVNKLVYVSHRKSTIYFGFCCPYYLLSRSGFLV